MPKMRVALSALLLVVPLMGACGSDDEPAVSGDDETSTTAAAAGDAAEVHIKAQEYSFGDVPDEAAGGTVTWKFTNTGKETHQWSFARLDAGKTIGDYAAFLKTELEQPVPDWVHAAGGPAADPGDTKSYTGTFEPGTYAIACHVPGPDGVPHHDKGMLAVFNVTEGQAGELPQTDLTLTAKDFTFTGMEGIKAGRQMIKFVNEGPESHEVVTVALAPGKKAKDVVEFFTAEGPPTGPPPFIGFPGLVSEVPAGSEAASDIEWKPGGYALMCFVANQKGPHFLQGMAIDVTVT